jgi:hypothetical protein
MIFRAFRALHPVEKTGAKADKPLEKSIYVMQVTSKGQSIHRTTVY